MKKVYQCEYCEYVNASQKASQAHEERCKTLYDTLTQIRKDIALGARIGPKFEGKIQELLEIKEKMKKNGS